MLKILMDHIMNHHMVTAAEGGRDHMVRGSRRPPLILWSISIFSIGHFLFFQHWALFVFQHWALFVLSVFGAQLFYLPSFLKASLYVLQKQNSKYCA